MFDLASFLSKNRKTLRFFAILGSATVIMVSGCQERLVLEDKTPFGQGGVRMGDTIVAEIDGTKIYLSDVERTAAAQGLIEAGSPLVPGNAIFQRVLDEKIDQRLLALEALKQALDQDDETRRRLNEAKERILANVIVEKHLADRVNETTVRRMYEEQATLADRGEERRVREIVTETEADMLNVLERHEKGESFSALARTDSIKDSALGKAGDLGFFSRDMIDPTLGRLIFQAEIGTLTDPIQTDKGWSVFKVEDRRRPAGPSFEDMRADILSFMTYDEMQQLVRTLRTNGEVKFLYGKSTSNISGSDDADKQTRSGKTGSELSTKSPSDTEATDQ